MKHNLRIYVLHMLKSHIYRHLISFLLSFFFFCQWYISCQSTEAQRKRLIKRHLETWSDEKTRMWGVGESGAAKKADANDVLNARFIEQSARYADVVIHSL